MNFFKKQWDQFKQKSLWGKFTDLLFVALIITVISSDGRIFLQRIVLETGLFGSFDENSNEVISDDNWQLPLMDLNGQQMNLAAFKGKKIFLNFWATWCPPCNAEIPSIVSLMDACKSNETTAFILVTNESPERVKAFLEKKGLDLPVYFIRQAPSNELAYSSLPTTFVINEEGKLVHRSKGARKWNDDETLSYFGCQVN
jgi:thiol-disulfide isomerase/thioredoxin